MTASMNDGQGLENSPVDGTALGSGYVLSQPLGQGAYGRVWRGYRRSDGSPVAIKVLRREYLADPDVLARFLRERTMLLGLNHPHLVAVEDLVVEGDTAAVVMELVDGQDLRRVVRRGQLDTDGALTVLAQVAHALAYIHAAKILHRDIKPENILVTERDGQPWARVADFGLAWVADGQTLTQASHVPGTPAYLAPEQLSGRPYGPEVDVYALGVTGYELLTGQRPFHGDNALALLRAHLEDDPQQPVGMPDDQWRVVRGCLAKNPKERPTAAQLVTLFDSLRSSRDDVRLGVDFGTCTATAVMSWPDGRVEPLLFDGSRRLPCAVYADPEGTIQVGQAALDAARQQPQCCEPYPKLRMADSAVRLGERDFEPVDLVAAVLRRVAGQAQRAAGKAPTRVTISHPVSWGADQIAMLDAAARAAGLPAPRMVTEGLAAAAHCVGLPTATVPIDAYAVIYDLGAATATASVVRRTANGGFELLATEQLPDAGGIDIDAVILAHLGEHLVTRAPQIWQRLSQPDNPQDQRAAWQLWYGVREAKESLSQGTRTTVHVPLLDRSVPLDRAELDELARPVLERTIALARAAVAAAGVADDAITATLLVGGSSRMPLVAAMLRQAFGHAPTAVHKPELVVAEGAAHLTPLPAPASIDIPVVPDGGPADAPGWRPARSPRSSDGRRKPVAVRRRSPAYLGPDSSDGISGGPGRRRRVRGGWLARVGGLKLPAVAGILVVAVAVTIGYTSLPSSSDSQTTSRPACGFKIGFLGTLAGGGIPSLRDAALLAVEQYNAAHANCTAQLVVLDTTDDAAGRAVSAAADHQILGVVGPMDAEEATVVLPVLEGAGIPAISPWLSDTRFGQHGYRVFHRTIGSNVEDAAAGARQLSQVLNANKTFVVDDHTINGMEASAEVRRRLGTTRLAGSSSINYSGTDHSVLINEITSSGATAVYYGGEASRGGLLVKQLRAVKPNITIVVDEWAFTGDFFKLAGNASAGVYVTCPCRPVDQAGRNFAALFKSRFNFGANETSPESFDAADVLLAGLAAGNDTRNKMLNWVARYDYEGVSGHIRFKGNGDRGNVTVWVWRMGADGSYKQVGALPPDGDRVSR